jgi:hypothetical protein
MWLFDRILSNMNKSTMAYTILDDTSEKRTSEIQNLFLLNDQKHLSNSWYQQKKYDYNI